MDVWKSLPKFLWNFGFVLFKLLTMTKQSVTNFGVAQLLQFVVVWTGNAGRQCPLYKTQAHRFIGPTEKNWWRFLKTPPRHILQIFKLWRDLTLKSRHIGDIRRQNACISRYKAWCWWYRYTENHRNYEEYGRILSGIIWHQVAKKKSGCARKKPFVSLESGYPHSYRKIIR